MRKQSLSIAVVAMLFASCGKPGSQGQVVGDYNTNPSYRPPTPVGMVWVPAGYLRTGYSDQDVQNALDAEVRNVQVQGFYMDATEITNAEYRQFTNWVRDSIAHTQLQHFVDNEDGSQRIDWKQKINWKDADVQDQLMNLYIPAEQSGWGKKEFDNTKLVYNFSYFDYEESVKSTGKPRTDFVVKKSIGAYPDTSVWIKQFNYSNNEPIALQYNWSPTFNEYPVVGVTWFQASAFAHWRTQLWKADRENRKLYFEGNFALPSETQWEWAARGGRQLSPYPWGGPYVANQKGCYLANFKPGRGDYAADGGLYTTRADAYWANDYGLFNMSGNVAEWTSTTYTVSAYDRNFLSDMNPDINIKIKDSDPTWLRRKVVKGGSWRDPAPFLQIQNRDYEFADTAKAYIGFRNIYVRTAEAIGIAEPASGTRK
ncbi:gliding motility-associated lipoprotein [Taibaiella sp. KBW10]|uniref:type IX secretion system lipoprotein PorK/GldK n=1 Tax=Taibaiella sp. KBW10 TaxID=2153357 RepID=UPI000F5B78B3|nr:SUMF1/EgtB/PvdO family nonheme iron enzyme [Taibaiella sp. KBW10]RQO30059.1 gliding motility-associated lipoprotein [Taibaiella sp. KBW10]